MELERRSLGAAHWPRQRYEVLFQSNPKGSQRFVWVAEDDSEAQTETRVKVSPKIGAFLVAHRINVEWELENIVVAEASRRRGIGTRLVGALIAASRTNGGKIFLEVRESNQAARYLYEKLGFKETGRRKAYYSDPPENAIFYYQGFS